MGLMRIDWDRLRIILLPHCLRHGALLESVLKSMYKPLKRDYAKLIGRCETTERELSYDSRVKRLRAAIAEQLWVSEEVIGINDVANREAVALRSDDQDPVDIWGEEAIENSVVENREAVALWSDDQVWWNREFVVTLPEGYSGREAEVRAVLDRWKMAGSRYRIEYSE